MMIKDDRYIEDVRFNERTHRFISAALVSLLMASAGLTVAQFGHQITPIWNGGYLVLIGLLIALERFYGYRALKKQSSLSREWIVLISTQWVVNFVVIKMIVSLSHGLDYLLAEIPLWQRAFAENFFTTDYIVAIIFAVLVWFIVGMLTELLDEMGLDAVLIAREAMATNIRDQAPPRQRLMAAVFAIGGGLMFLTAVARVDTRALLANEAGVLRELSPLEGGGAGTLLYFLFAFLLLSQAQYITLNTRWFLQGVPVSRSIAVNWAIYCIGFLTLIVLVVSFLPTNYSLGLLSVLGYLLDIVMGFMVLILSILMAIVGFLLSLPFLLFGLGEPTNLPEMIVQPPLETPPSTIISESTPFPWLDLLKSMLFWAVFLIVIGYSVSQYLRQHEEILDGLRRIPGWKILSAIWHWINGIFKGFNRRVVAAFDAGKAYLQPQGKTGRISAFQRFTRLRSLSPRQKVLFYYYALIRRGDETGLSRKGSQTPEEYSTTLKKSLPTVKDELSSLTEAFYKARYSNHSIKAEDAEKTKTYWGQIRRIFRGRRG